MRKLLISLLLAATAATPAMAEDQGMFGGRSRDRAAHNSSNDHGSRARPERARSQRGERDHSARESRHRGGGERTRFSRDDGLTRAAPRADRAETMRRPRIERQRDRDIRIEETVRRPRLERRAETDTQTRVTRVRRGDRATAERFGGWRRPQGDETVRVHRDRTRDPNETLRSGSDRQWSDRQWSGRKWTSQWRSDNRYDWRRHRDRHRSIYRFGNYWDPYGYRYRRYSIGFNLWPSYYRSSYWLDDPWMYRLPPAYGPYRWVRYYNDAVLVNIYTGEVVDVVYNFFW